MVHALREGVSTSIASQGLGRARTFFSPGKLLYYEKRYKALLVGGEDNGNAPSEGGGAVTGTSGDGPRKGPAVFVPRWMDNAELAAEGLVVGARMFKLQ